MTDTQSTNHPAAAAAANWWAEQVGAPTFRATDHRDAPEDRDRMGLAGMMAGLLADANPVSAESGAKFAEALAATLTEQLDGAAKWGVSLGVDYGPDMTLANASKAAGVASSRFPWKTRMTVRPDHVTASLGYGARDRLVWASEEWLANRPTCMSQRWDETRGGGEVEYHGDPFACSLPMYHEDACRYDRAISLCAACGAAERWPRHSPDAFNGHDFVALPVGQSFEAVSK